MDTMDSNTPVRVDGGLRIPTVAEVMRERAEAQTVTLASLLARLERLEADVRGIKERSE